MSSATITLIILGIAIILFITDKLPISVVSIGVSISLLMTGVLDHSKAFGGFIDKNVILIIATFVVGGAFFETGMAYKVGTLATKFAKNERQLMTWIMLLTSLMSSVLSNIGTAVVLFPIVMGIAQSTGYKPSRLLMPVIIGATTGCLATFMGTPAIPMVSAALEEATGKGLSFLSTAPFGIAVLVASVIFFYFVGYRFIPERESEETNVFFSKDYSNVPAWKQYTALGVLIFMIIAMIFENKIGVPMYESSVIAALILVISGVITEKQAIESVSWKTVFLVGGMLSMATALNSTGAGAVVANAIVNLCGNNASPLFMTAIMYLVSWVLTQFMSNAACISMMMPIGIAVSQALNADPTAVLMAILAGGSLAFCTPLAQPMNSMIYGPGGYRFSDYVKSGLPISIVCFVVCICILPIVYPFFG